MNVFLVIPTMTVGGAERVISELANEWSTYNNTRVHLVLLTNEIIEYEISNQVIIHKLFFVPRGGFFQKLFGLAKTLFSLRSLYRSLKPRFVLSFMNKYNVFVLCSLFGIKDARVFVSERDNPYEKIPFLTKYLRKITYPKASGIICQTQKAKDVFSQSIPNNNYTVISNPIRNTFIQCENKEKIILCVGRLTEKKGQKFLIDMAALLNMTGWKICILGDGPIKNSLQDYSERKGVQNDVIFCGQVSNVDDWLSKASIFVFPSLWEGFPNALAEAMVAGLPVVSFDCDTGPRDLIVDGVNGYLVELKDVKSLAMKVDLLMRDKSLRESIGSKAREVYNDLTVKRISQSFFDFCK